MRDNNLSVEYDIFFKPCKYFIKKEVFPFDELDNHIKNNLLWDYVIMLQESLDEEQLIEIFPNVKQCIDNETPWFITETIFFDYYDFILDDFKNSNENIMFTLDGKESISVEGA